jgi:hypothetical protein
MNHKWLGLIGIIIFIYLISNINLSLLIKQFRSINLFLFVISLSLIIPCIAIKSFKWLLLVEKKDRISLLKGMFAWTVGFGYGLITPARLGDFLRAKFLNVKLGKSLLTVLIDRLNDVFVLFILGSFSFLILISKAVYLYNITYLFIIFFILFLIGILILQNKLIVGKLGKPFYKFLVPKKFKKFVGSGFDEFYKNLEKLSKKKVVYNFILTILAWFISFTQYWFLALALGLNLSYFSICLVSPLLLLVQLIPISISGIGTREAAAILILSVFSIIPEQAIAFSLGILVEDYILAALGLGLWFKVKS